MREHPVECPTLETLARLLQSELGEEVVHLALRRKRRQQDIEHWMDSCDRCRENLQTLEQWQDELDHPDLVLVARERPQAWQLWEALEHLPESFLKRSLKPHHVFWGMATKIMLESREALAVSARRGMLLAEIAVGMTDLLVDSYPAREIIDLRVKGWCFLGNARRVGGRLAQADEMFARAAALLPKGTGRPMVRGLFCDLLGSLRKDQQRFQEADETLAESATLYELCGHPSLVGKIRLLQGLVAELNGRLDQAIERLTEAQRLIVAHEDPVLYAHCQHHLIYYLLELGQLDEVALRLPVARRLWQQLGNRRAMMKLRWVEGQMYQKLGLRAEAETAFEEAARGMRDSNSSFDYALLQLDQAYLSVESGKFEKVLDCCSQAYEVLRQESGSQECLTALKQLQESVKDRLVTGELIIQVASLVRCHRKNRAS